MAAKPPTTLSIKHHAIMDYMLQNPSASGKQVADYIGVTQAWLSTLIHSDAFQAELAQRRADITIQIAQDIPTRLRSLTHLALANLESAYDLGVGITTKMDMEVIRMGMDAEGIGKQAQAPVQPSVNISINVDATTLAAAREKMINLNPTPTLVETEVGLSPLLTLEPTETK